MAKSKEDLMQIAIDKMDAVKGIVEKALHESVEASENKEELAKQYDTLRELKSENVSLLKRVGELDDEKAKLKAKNEELEKDLVERDCIIAELDRQMADLAQELEEKKCYAKSLEKDLEMAKKRRLESILVKHNAPSRFRIK